jgi:hypothetical protein
MPIAPPRKRKPTVSNSSGWPTTVVQIVPIWVITAEATDARSDSRVLIVAVRSFLSHKLELTIYLHNLAEEPECKSTHEHDLPGIKIENLGKQYKDSISHQLEISNQGRIPPEIQFRIAQRIEKVAERRYTRMRKAAIYTKGSKPTGTSPISSTSAAYSIQAHLQSAK